MFNYVYANKNTKYDKYLHIVSRNIYVSHFYLAIVTSGYIVYTFLLIH